MDIPDSRPVIPLGMAAAAAAEDGGREPPPPPGNSPEPEPRGPPSAPDPDAGVQEPIQELHQESGASINGSLKEPLQEPQPAPDGNPLELPKQPHATSNESRGDQSQEPQAAPDSPGPRVQESQPERSTSSPLQEPRTAPERDPQELQQEPTSAPNSPAQEPRPGSGRPLQEPRQEAPLAPGATDAGSPGRNGPEERDGAEATPRQAAPSPPAEAAPSPGKTEHSSPEDTEASLRGAEPSPSETLPSLGETDPAPGNEEPSPGETGPAPGEAAPSPGEAAPPTAEDEAATPLMLACRELNTDEIRQLLEDQVSSFSLKLEFQILYMTKLCKSESFKYQVISFPFLSNFSHTPHFSTTAIFTLDQSHAVSPTPTLCSNVTREAFSVETGLARGKDPGSDWASSKPQGKVWEPPWRGRSFIRS